MDYLSITITDHRTGSDRSITICQQPGQLVELGPGETICAAPSGSARRFVENGDGTVTDTTTGLMWSAATLTDSEVSQHKALAICGGLDLAGHDDWRLPTRAELLSLVDDTRHQPAIDTEAFPDTRSGWYWTSTEAAWSSARAWIVHFGDGFAGDSHRDYDLGFVRAVRGVPAGQ